MFAAQIVEILGLELGVFLAMLMFVVFMGMILTGFNVAFSFAATALAFAFIGDMTNAISLDVFDPGTLAGQLPTNWARALRSQELLAVPLFVMMGAILERSGMAERLLNAFGLLMGSLRGGVAAAVIVVGTLLAAATGVVAATVIVMGLLSLPAMVRLGYDNQLATGAITASGTLAQMLPPSIVLILLAGELGVGIIGLFAGAVLPGLLLSALYIAYTLFVSFVRPDVGPTMPPEERMLAGNPSTRTAGIIGAVLGTVVFLVMLLIGLTPAIVGGLVIAAISFALVARFGMLTTELVVSIIPILVLIAGVLISIFRGLATPSESGAVGVFGALILAGMNFWFDRLLVADGAEHIEPHWKLDREALKDATLFHALRRNRGRTTLLRSGSCFFSSLLSPKPSNETSSLSLRNRALCERFGPISADDNVRREQRWRSRMGELLRLDRKRRGRHHPARRQRQRRGRRDRRHRSLRRTRRLELCRQRDRRCRRGPVACNPNRGQLRDDRLRRDRHADGLPVDDVDHAPARHLRGHGRVRRPVRTRLHQRQLLVLERGADDRHRLRDERCGDRHAVQPAVVERLGALHQPPRLRERGAVW